MCKSVQRLDYCSQFFIPLLALALQLFPYGLGIFPWPMDVELGQVTWFGQ